jgi:leader peptidase (prepilin peptidase)/N-methyltransferase
MDSLLDPALRFDLPVWIVFPYLFVIGAIVGSFLNVCVYRIPTQERLADQLRMLWNRPSNCPRCRTNIRWYDNIPIFGWLKLRGRCRTCRMWISPRYPLVEFFNGCLWVLVVWLEVPFGFSARLSDSCVFADIGPQTAPGLGIWTPEWFVLARCAFHLVLFEALLVASLIDWDLRIIPDGSTVPAMILAVLAQTLGARLHLVPVWFQSANMQQSFALVTPEWFHPLLAGPAVPAWIGEHPHLHGLAVSLAGFVIGGGSVWVVRILGQLVLRQEAMGFGDVILMAMIGAFLGWQPVLIAFFIAPACAMVMLAGQILIGLVACCFGRQVPVDRMIPYGPYLSLGAVLTVLAWQPLFARTRHLFEMGALLLPVGLVMGIVFAVSLLIVHYGKRWLGFSSEPPAAGIWRSADQLWFFQGERVDRHTGRWRTRDWEGNASGQGMSHVERWRYGTGSGRPWNRSSRRL